MENFELNYQIFYFLNNFAFQNTYLDLFFIFIAKYLIFILIIIFLIFFGKLIWQDKKIEIKEFLIYFTGSISAWFFVKILKQFIVAERPFSILENIKPLIERTDIYNSFPSGHSAFSYALAISIFFYNKKLGIISIFLATLIALGRVFTGIHFPLDIFIGFLVGIIIPIIIYKILKKYNDK